MDALRVWLRCRLRRRAAVVWRCMALVLLVLPTAKAADFETIPTAPLPISDGTGEVLASLIEVPDTGVVSTVEVSLRIAHSFVGDLQIKLVAPDGTEVLLLDSPGVGTSEFGDSSNLSATFPVRFAQDASVAAERAGEGCTNSEVIGQDCPGDLLPTGDLATFNGIDAQGAWRLILIDEVEGFAGTFEGWSLSLHTTGDRDGGNAGVIQFQETVHFADITFLPGEVFEIPVAIERAGGSAGTVSVDFAASSAGATPGVDYQPVSIRLTWADGESSPKVVNVPFFRPDSVSIPEDADTVPQVRIIDVNLVLSRPTGGAILGEVAAAVLYLKDGIAIFSSSDLSVTLDVDDGPVVTGQPFEYRVRVVNHGPFSLASDVILGFWAPPEVDVLGTAGAACSAGAPFLSCALGTMDIGQVETLRVTAQVRDDGSTAVRRILPIAEAQITGGIDFDLNTSNNTAEMAHDVLPPARGTGFQIGSGISGSWYDPSHNGEGFLVEVLPEGRGLVYWFTYDASGNQTWLFGTGTVSGNTLVINDAFTTEGGVFGPTFDPGAVQLVRWGNLRFVFSSCTSGVMDYRGPPGFGNGVLQIERLTYIAGGVCPESGGDGSGPLRAATSGSYYDPERAGEGFLVEVLSADVALVYWFTYDLEGNQAWIVGLGRVAGTSIVVEQSFITNGPVFGPNFDPEAKKTSHWGTLRLTFDNCASGRMTYESVIGFGNAGMNLARLTMLAGHPCIE